MPDLPPAHATRSMRPPRAIYRCRTPIVSKPDIRLTPLPPFLLILNALPNWHFFSPNLSMLTNPNFIHAQ